VGAGSAYAGNELYKKIKNLRTKENLKSEEAARPEPKQEVLPKVIPIDSMPKAEKTGPPAVEPKKDSVSPEIFTAGGVLATREADKNSENLTLEELEKKIVELSNNTNKALDDVEAYLNEPNPDYFEYDDMLDKAWNYLTNDNWEKITGAVSEENPQTILTLEKLWNDSVKNLMERRAKITDKAEKIFNLNSEPIPDNFSGDLPADDGGDDDNKKEENKIEILGKNNEQLPAEPVLDMGRRVEMLDEIVTKQSSSFDKVFEYLQRPDATLQGFRDMDAKIELVFTPEFGKKLTSGATEEEISKLNKLGNKALDFLNTKWDGIAALADEKFFISKDFKNHRREQVRKMEKAGFENVDLKGLPFNRFFYLMKEDSILKLLFKEDEVAKKKTELLEALTDLNLNNNRKTLEDYCLGMLEYGNNISPESFAEAQHILGEMEGLSPAVAKIIEDARKEFRQQKKKSKK
jgi:hypothetical protein